MGEVVQLRRVQRAAPETTLAAAYAALTLALAIARTSGSIRDMAAAVRAYETWLELAIPDPAERAEVWP